MATNYASLSVGSEVTINVGGEATTFVVLCQGKPSTAYDDSCDGTWLMAKDTLFAQTMHASSNDYKNSVMHTYLNETWLPTLDSSVRAAVKEVKIPYTNGTGSGGSLATGASGLPTKAFILSTVEVGGSRSYANNEGTRLPYYANGGKVGLSGNAWWLRSPDTMDATDYWAISGSSYQRKKCYTTGIYVRPVIVIGSSPSLCKINVGGSVKECPKAYVLVDGTLKEVVKIYKNVDGTLKG